MGKSDKNTELSKFQKFETAIINRKDIKKAEYNPRKISDEAKKKLRVNIEKVGLLDTIVVNKNTMNIVSGHQRIGILDTLERKKDYNLTVAMVDLTEKEEKEQNIFFNNPKSQGEYDPDLLSELLNYDSFDLENTGFDYMDLSIIGVSNIEVYKDETEIQPTEKMALNLNGVIYDNKNQLRKDMQNFSKQQNQNQTNTYIILSFNTEENKENFLNRFGFPNNERYIKGEHFSEMIERVE